ncbi:MAG: ABC transporter permease [Porphyromonas sp.]|nr:ABC transporter permease [Porphyromonas sp.]
MKKLGVIISREYREKVLKKSFIIFTILTPIFFIAISFIPAILMNTKSTTDEEKVVLVADQPGKYFSHLQNKNGFRFISTSKSLEQEHADGTKMYAYMLISEDLLENPKGIKIFTEKQVTSELADLVHDQLIPVLQEERISSFDIPNLKSIIDDTKVRLDIQTAKTVSSGEDSVSSSAGLASALGMITNFVMYFFIFMYGMMVFASVREEKKNRVVEVIISSVQPFQLLLGKIIAALLIGFTQLFIWAVVFIAGVVLLQFFMFDTFTTSIAEIKQISAAQESVMMDGFIEEILMPLQSINFTLIFVAFLIYFLGGYLIYASLYAAVGSAIDNDEDGQQLMMPVTIISLLAFYFGFYAANNPDAPLTVFGSMFPLSSPVVMMVRLPFEPPMWQLVLSVVILIASALGSIWFASRIYRVGILMYGKKPSYKTLMQWLRYK